MFKRINLKPIKINFILSYISLMTVGFVHWTSMLGVFLFLFLFFQCISGVMLSFSLISEPMLIPQSRNEEDMDDLYMDDFFWLHERGVDYIFICFIFHFLRKFYFNYYSINQELAWKTGVFAFLLTHAVMFFGLTLSCTHLSDITLTIAANIINTFTFKFGKFYWWLFTDQTLNTDSILRLMYGHYVLAFFTLYIGMLHSFEMHESWYDIYFTEQPIITIFWGYETLKIEYIQFLKLILVFSIFGYYTYSCIEPLSFELFMWGDVGLITDVRFLGVAPHWYFRSYMGWLLLCPHHYLGIFGLAIFMIILFYQPNIKLNFLKFNSNLITNLNILPNNFIMGNLFIFFFFNFLYTNSSLPYGRFFNRIGGNTILLLAYLFIFIYLFTSPFLFIYKVLWIFENNLNFLWNLLLV